MAATITPEPGTRGTAHLDDLCRTVFESLARSDQRRWAEAYVRGLVQVPGRKSIRRIAEHVAGPSTEQCLQQFVNQSPWDWAPVRHVLGRMTETVLSPRAWVVQEIDFPKRGQSSVGVETQYVPGAGRTFNCQVGMAVWTAGLGGSVPVNWRLMLPASWDDDGERRTKVRLPDTERHRTPADHILSAVDEMVESWDFAPRPVVGDRRHDRQLEPLLQGLEERCLRYAVRISDRTPVRPSDRREEPLRAGNLMRSTARELIALPPERMPQGYRSRRGRSPMVTHALVPSPGASPRTGPLHTRARRVVARWPRGRSQPGELWLTNMGMAPLPELIDILDVGERTMGQSTRLRQECGLDHFEGRSYRGWHHHVTLASVAHAYGQLSQAGSDGGSVALRPAQ